MVQPIIERCARGAVPFQILADRLVQNVLVLTMPWFFTAGGSPPPFAEQARVARVPRCAVDWRRRGWQPLAVGTRVGRVPVAFRVHGDAAPGAPLTIFHHGAGELPVDICCSRILAAGALPGPLVLVRGAGHRDLRGFAHQMRTVTGAALLMAASSAAIEGLRRAWEGPVLVAGISLGGMIALLHARRWGIGAVAAGPVRWAPLAAGPDLRHTVAHGAFARLVAPATRRLMTRTGLLSADDLAPLPAIADRVHPLLGTYDQVHCLRPQLAAYRRLGIRPRVVPRSHIALSLDGAVLHGHLRAVLRRLETEGTGATGAA